VRDAAPSGGVAVGSEAGGRGAAPWTGCPPPGVRRRPHRTPRDRHGPPWCWCGSARPRSRQSPGPSVTAAPFARATVQADPRAGAPGTSVLLPTDSATTAPPCPHGEKPSPGDSAAVTTPSAPRPETGWAPGPRPHGPSRAAVCLPVDAPPQAGAPGRSGGSPRRASAASRPIKTAGQRPARGADDT
jgi:hypothetical protein